MIKVYIISCDAQEVEDKASNQITDEEFKLFGKEHSLKELENDLNNGDENVYNHYNDYVRFIETNE